MSRLSAVLFFLFCIGVAASASQAAMAAASVPEQWTKPGAHWRVKVTQYSRGRSKMSGLPLGVDQAKVEFEMTIAVLSPSSEEGRQLARFEFMPAKGAPVDVSGQKYLLEVELASGRAHALKLGEGRYPGTFAIEPAGEESPLLTEVFGFPVDWIVRIGDLAGPSPASARRAARVDNTHLVLTKSLSQEPTDGRNAVRIDLSLPDSIAAGPSKRVVQTWVPGEPWWRKFQRYRGGELDLEATLIPD